MSSDFDDERTKVDATSGRDDGTLSLREQKPLEMALPTRPACIVLLHPPGPAIGRRTELSRSRYTVGRESGGATDIAVERESVSRAHAELWRDSQDVWHARDLGSTNGTFVNEQRIDTRPLRDGDQVRFGDAIYKFLSGSNIETMYHEEIYRLTILDGLTGLHNKRYFSDFLERELSSAHRHNHPLSLVMFDIDHFKRINDERTHLGGDKVLRQIADRLRPRIRREDLLARYGGEEFAVVLTSTPLPGGIKFAEIIRRMLAAAPFEYQGDRFAVTVSLGVACVDRMPTVAMDQFIQMADNAMYEAKRLGRDQVRHATDP